ncbi:MAG: hypothetical protein HPZ91_01840 [Lentisphaeria bacterium]|nr:hypothetical protein [Lentisphaeria bacterium]
MKKRNRQTFTLIELLVVMLLMGLIMSLMLPAFNKMIRGNKVDQLASNLKLGLEQAQSNAVRSRKYVALVLPNDRSKWGGTSTTAKNKALREVQPFSHGGFRLAYVQPMTGGWEFVRWVQGQEWKNAPDGAMLVRVLEKDDNDFDSYEAGDGVGGVVTDVNTAFEELEDLKNYKFKASDGSDTQYTEDIKDCLIVFSPYGGLKGDQDLRFVIAEAIPSGTDIVYPVKDSAGTAGNPKPVNWLMLSINKFTGRVEYYPLPD